MRLAAHLLVAALLAALAAACLPGAAAARPPVAFGTFTPGAPESRQAIEDFNSMIGRRAAIFHTYKNWDWPPFQYQTVGTSWEAGAVPMITWEPIDRPLQAIARGDYDGYITQSARDAVAFGRPILLRFAHEMNGDWTPWSLHPRDYVAAWRHIVRIFRREGASQVHFVWSPNTGSFDEYFPGDRWVDYVALDGYNFGAKYNSWDSFSAIFDSSYRDLVRLSRRPVIIAEFASTDQGGDKAAWMRDTLSSGVLDRYPRIRALVWFNIDKEADWRINSSGDTLAAFRSMIQGPLFDLDADGLLALARNGAHSASSDPNGALHCAVPPVVALRVNARWNMSVPIGCDSSSAHGCFGWVKVRRLPTKRKLGFARLELWPGRGQPLPIGLPGWAHGHLARRRSVTVRLKLHADAGCVAGATPVVSLTR